MGMDRTVEFSGSPPGWDVVRDELVSAGFSPVLRMIDGLPAFPDEVPEPGWSELRIGLPGGMVTLRRDGSTLRCVVWGNADAELQSSWAALEVAVRAAVAKGNP